MESINLSENENIQVSTRIEELALRLGRGAVLNSIPELMSIAKEVRQLEQSVIFDSLTKAYSLSSLIPEIKRSTALLSRLNGMTFGLGVVDLDNFKTINDNFGHDFGDQVLVTTVNRLKYVLRNSDKVFRTGGDEFVLYFDGIDCHEGIGTLRLDEIRRTLATAIPYHDRFIDVSASVGYSQAFDNELGDIVYGDPDKVEQIVKFIRIRADKAMYDFKKLKTPK